MRLLLKEDEWNTNLRQLTLIIESLVIISVLSSASHHPAEFPSVNGYRPETTPLAVLSTNAMGQTAQELADYSDVKHCD